MSQEELRPRFRVRVWYRRMSPRDSEEPHRAATPLELLFDLCFVVAVSRAASALHHAVAENHVGHGVLSFCLVFFAIWWAWLQFTWFASAFDTDDVPYRLATLVQIAGGLTIAAGISSAFEGDFTVVVIGYVLMRLAMVAQWLRVAKGNPAHRITALRYAGGIVFVQILWTLRLLLPDSLALPSFFALVVLELAVPVFAESARLTPWHPRHIAERYGLFTIIVLGETVLSSATAIEDAVRSGNHLPDLVSLSAAGLVLLFAMWWLYFDQPAHNRLTALRPALFWGYGHYLIFGAAAALGAGLEVAVDYDTHHAGIPSLLAASAVTVPVAVYLLFVWLLHVGPKNECRPIAIGFPVAAVLALACSFTPAPVHFAAGVCAALVLTVVLATHNHPTES